MSRQTKPPSIRVGDRVHYPTGCGLESGEVVRVYGNGTALIYTDNRQRIQRRLSVLRRVDQ